MGGMVAGRGDLIYLFFLYRWVGYYYICWCSIFSVAVGMRLGRGSVLFGGRDLCTWSLRSSWLYVFRFWFFGIFSGDALGYPGEGEFSVWIYLFSKGIEVVV
jgi:hypothetical protein